MRLEARALDGLEQFLEAAPEITRQAAKLAMNDVTGGEGLTTYKKAMRTQIAFPAGYLEDVDRFGQTGYATEARLETVISARQRPTSLARFMTSGSVGKAGVTVRVGADSSRRLSKAFPVRLRAGAGLTDDSFNLGLAVRVAPGQTIRNKKDTSRMVHLAPNVLLLYAPSVDQVFRSVGVTETPKVLDRMGQEFLRQFTRLSAGRG
jgi:hypothetical protein